MVNIRRYSEPQVAPIGIQGGMEQKTESQGAKVLQLAGQAAQIMVQEKEKADTYRAEDAYNKLQEQKIQRWSEATTKQGENAFDVHNEYISKYDQDAEKIAMDMGGAAADKFRQAAARGRMAFSAQLQSHQNGQIENAKHKTALSGINLSFDEAGKNAGTLIAEQAINRAAYLAGMEADRQGLKGDAYSEMVLGVTSKGHIANIKGMMDRDPMGAKSYLEANKDYMMKDDYDRIKGPLDGMAVEHEAVKMADQIESKFKVWDSMAMDKEARAIAGNDANKLKALRNELDYRGQKKVRATNEAQGSLIASYIGMDGRPRLNRSQIVKTDTYLNMNDVDRKELRDKLDVQDERMQGKESKEVNLNRWYEFGKLKDNPALLSQVTPAQLIGMGFDTDQTKKLLDAKLASEGKLSGLQNVSVPKADFDRIMEENGFFTKSMDKGRNGEYQKIKSELEDAMKVEQLAKNRPLNDTERDAIAERLVGKVRKVNKGWGPNPEVRMREIKDSSEIAALPDETGKMVDITREERTAAYFRLAVAGLDLNDPFNFKTVVLDERAKKSQKGQK